MIKTLPVVCAVVLLFPLSRASEAQQRGSVVVRKTASAAKIAGGAIDIDGRIDEKAWSEAQPITDFVQKEPVEGAPPILTKSPQPGWAADVVNSGQLASR